MQDVRFCQRGIVPFKTSKSTTSESKSKCINCIKASARHIRVFSRPPKFYQPNGLPMLRNARQEGQGRNEDNASYNETHFVSSQCERAVNRHGRLECFLNICGPVKLYAILQKQDSSSAKSKKQYRQEPLHQGSGLVWGLADALAGAESRGFCY
jgi:hypothetical protein